MFKESHHIFHVTVLGWKWEETKVQVVMRVSYREAMHELFSMTVPHHFNDVEKYVIQCQPIVCDSVCMIIIDP